MNGAPESEPRADAALDEEVEREAARRIPLWPWAIVVGAGVWLVLVVQDPALQAVAALPALFAAIRVWRVPRQRAALRQALKEQRLSSPGRGG